MNEWIPVVDTAVKIGLGASIAGFIAFISSWQSNRHESAKEYTVRRRNVLEKMGEAFAEVHQKKRESGARYSALIQESNPIQKKIHQDWYDKFLSETSIFEMNLQLHLIETRLLMFGHKEVADKVRDYHMLPEIDHATTPNEVLKRRIKLVEVRGEILEEFSKALKQ